MTVYDDIIEARRCGYTRCGAIPSSTVGDVAKAFGLKASAVYHEIDSAEARTLIELILHEDMAYHVEIMDRSIAANLAALFLAEFNAQVSRFYTNRRLVDGAAAWNPATDATFDTGVLVVGRVLSGCLWVEDED